MHLVFWRMRKSHTDVKLHSCKTTATEVPLTFLVYQRSTQTEDVTYHHVYKFRKNGMLHRKRDVVCNATVFGIPDFKQGQTYIYSPDYKCVVCGSFPNLYKVISTNKKKCFYTKASLLMSLSLQ